MNQTCPKCGVLLEKGKGARDPTWVSPYPKNTSKRVELDKIGRIWCRKCAVNYHTKKRNPSIVVDGFTIDNWSFDTSQYSKKELIRAREISYNLWREYNGFTRFYVFRNFFQEIFKRTFDQCKNQGKIMEFPDILEIENTERTLCKWDWIGKELII